MVFVSQKFIASISVSPKTSPPAWRCPSRVTFHRPDRQMLESFAALRPLRRQLPRIHALPADLAAEPAVYGRLCGEISWQGVNSGQLSSKRAKRGEGFQHLTIGAVKSDP